MPQNFVLARLFPICGFGWCGNWQSLQLCLRSRHLFVTRCCRRKPHKNKVYPFYWRLTLSGLCSLCILKRKLLTLCLSHESLWLSERCCLLSWEVEEPVPKPEVELATAIKFRLAVWPLLLSFSSPSPLLLWRAFRRLPFSILLLLQLFTASQVVLVVPSTFRLLRLHRVSPSLLFAFVLLRVSFSLLALPAAF